jgi:hypothetical protein
MNFVSIPKLLIMVDQFGIAHAPFAQARALLSEYGFNDLQVIVYNDKTCTADIVHVQDLVPQPHGARVLCASDFS